ncbi:MAG: LysM peptidoglycan-binding domain-containing protein [Bacteroidetes bacterium]|nr:LysM peptidoglycan-binding domain-containing protein [Bacteroidota bacterium]
MLNIGELLKGRTRLLVIILVLFSCNWAFAQEAVIKRSTVVEQYKGKPYYLHFVQEGQTITSICKAYNVSREELITENPSLQEGLKMDQVLRIPQKPQNLDATPADTKQISPANPVLENKAKTPDKVIAPPKADKGKVYLVKKQETLYGISKQFGISVEELQKANPELTVLKEGMEITIPQPASESKPKEVETNPKTVKSPTHGEYKEITVQMGQTVYSLSKQYGISEEEFLRLNPEVSTGLKTDQVVKVPALGGSTGNPGPGMERRTSVDKEVEKAPQTQPFDRDAKSHVKGIDTCKNAANLSRTYEIALLLPFDLENTDSIFAQTETSAKTVDDFKSYDFFQFYNGILMAADSLEKEGFKAHINVYDADKEADTLKIRKVLKKIDLSGMDLVIGPVFARSFDVASRYALKNKVKIINPLSRRDKLVAGNPFVYMAQSTEEAMLSGLASFLLRNYKGANVIICRNGTKETAALSAVFLKNLKKSDSLSTLHIKEVNYTVESFAGITKNLSESNHNVVLMFSDNRSMIPSFVSLLNAANKNQNITLLGLPGWETLGIETEFLSKLDYHEVTQYYIDYNSEAVNRFVKQYRAKYNIEPLLDKQAFLGFDIGWYFFNALMNYGPDFNSCLKNMNIEGVQTNFRYYSRNNADGFQNQSYRIIHLNDYKWVESR